MVHETSSFCFFLVVGSTTTFSKLQLYYLQRRMRAFSLLPLLLKAGALPQPLPGISYARGGKVAPRASAKTPCARVVSGLDRRHVFETRVFDVYRFSIFDFFVIFSKITERLLLLLLLLLLYTRVMQTRLTSVKISNK